MRAIWGSDLWTGRRERDRGYNENNDNPFINPFDVMREHGVQFDDIDWDPFSDWIVKIYFRTIVSPRITHSMIYGFLERSSS